MLNLPITIALLAVTAGCAATPTVSRSGSVVKLRVVASGYRLTLNDKPFLIKGAGGSSNLDIIRASGGNSIRTWGADTIGDVLAQARKQGLMVTVGMWLGHGDVFDYHDPVKVRQQFDSCKAIVLRYKDDPNVLIWAFGNEMEAYDGGRDPAVFNAIEDLAKMAHSIDPNHPTMTVFAEVGGDKVANLNRYCPDIDILGINSYGGAPSLATRYRTAGGTKPYVLTEFGPLGQWEVGKTAWGAPFEQTSTEKAAHYRESYQAAVLNNREQCLGSYAFLWGHKMEATPTWFGMFLPSGERTQAVDVMAELWSGLSPAIDSPTIQSLAIVGGSTYGPGETVRVSLACQQAQRKALKVRWVLASETAQYNSGGAGDPGVTEYPDALQTGGLTGATFKVPTMPGAYRIYAYVLDGDGRAAVANVPISVH